MNHNSEEISSGSRCLDVLALFVLATIVVLVACGKVIESTDSQGIIAITNCTIIDGTGDAPVPDAILVISDGLIADVGQANTIVIPEDARIIDVEGATVLPGFFNAHIHNGFNEENLKAWAQAGVTTVRDLGGPSLFSWKNERLKDPYCARLIAAGPMVSVPGGYPFVPWGSPNMLPVNSPEDAENKVTDLLNDGADIVKIAMESGQEFGRIIPFLSPEEAIAAVNTAHDLETIVSAHVLVSSDLARALAAGVDDIAHMVIDYLPDSLINEMVRNDVLWVPTLELWHHVGYGRRELAIGNLRKFVQAGGQVVLGTDYDGYYAEFQIGMPIDEMEWMAQAGMPSMQIIVAGTKNAASSCNRLSDLGTLEAGKIADILVVNGDPLDDIHNLTKVRLVIHGGQIIRNSGN